MKYHLFFWGGPLSMDTWTYRFFFFYFVPILCAYMELSNSLASIYSPPHIFNNHLASLIIQFIYKPIVNHFFQLIFKFLKTNLHINSGICHRFCPWILQRLNPPPYSIHTVKASLRITFLTKGIFF